MSATEFGPFGVEPSAASSSPRRCCDHVRRNCRRRPANGSPRSKSRSKASGSSPAATFVDEAIAAHWARSSSERLGAGRDERGAVQAQNSDRRAALDGGRGDRAILGIDEVVLRVVVARLEQERALAAQRVARRPRRRSLAAHGEAGALEALAVGAARVHVLPGIGEPPVVVGTQGPVERERAARWPVAVDEHRALGQRRLAVDALPGARVPQRRTDLDRAEQAVVEDEALLGAVARRSLEEGARPPDGARSRRAR